MRLRKKYENGVRLSFRELAYLKRVYSVMLHVFFTTPDGTEHRTAQKC
jgi:hypothetical protein